MTAPLYVPAPIWPEAELRDFCRAILRAFPGAKITVVERGQGGSGANNPRSEAA